MARPYSKKRVSESPRVTFYKPRGVPLSTLETVVITLEEWEALRLKHFEKYDQTSSAKKMNISQSTFQRLLASAHHKVSEAIILGKAIKVVSN